VVGDAAPSKNAIEEESRQIAASAAEATGPVKEIIVQLRGDRINQSAVRDWLLGPNGLLVGLKDQLEKGTLVLLYDSEGNFLCRGMSR
jgi:hypothetical protein